MKKLLSLIVVASMTVYTSKVFAQVDVVTPTQKSEEVKGFYGTLGLGYSAPQDVTGTTKIDETIPAKLNYGFNGGFAGEVGMGYDFGTLRTELTYINNNASINSLGLSAAGIGVDTNINSVNVNSNSVMASIYLDIPTNSRWVPYVGGGLGYTNISVGSQTISVPTFGEETSNLSKISKGVLGYQAKVGLSYLANKKTDIFVEGVYQGSSGFEESSVDYGSVNTWGTRLGARFRF